MSPAELCARNLSAALREAENAKLAARCLEDSVHELTVDLIEGACDLLKRAGLRIAQTSEPPSKTPPETPPKGGPKSPETPPAPKGPASPAPALPASVSVPNP